MAPPAKKPKKSNLRGFLRKEVQRERNKIKPPPTSTFSSTSNNPKESEKLFADDDDDDIDSLWGDPPDPDDSLTPLERFAKTTSPTTPPSRKRERSDHAKAIDELKKELLEVLDQRVLSKEELKLLEEKRMAFIEEIRKHEVAENHERRKKMRVLTNYKDGSIPEPIGQHEKELLMNTHKAISEARQDSQMSAPRLPVASQNIEGSDSPTDDQSADEVEEDEKLWDSALVEQYGNEIIEKITAMRENKKLLLLPNPKKPKHPRIKPQDLEELEENYDGEELHKLQDSLPKNKLKYIQKLAIPKATEETLIRETAALQEAINRAYEKLNKQRMKDSKRDEMADFLHEAFSQKEKELTKMADVVAKKKAKEREKAEAATRGQQGGLFARMKMAGRHEMTGFKGW